MTTAIDQVNALLNATKPILYETGVEEWPYAYSGTCFPVKYRDTLYIVSAEHCFVNFQIKPEQTLYISPCNGRTAFAFDLKVHASCPTAKDNKHHDQLVLRVALSKHPKEETQVVQALDLADPRNSKRPTSASVKDIVLRGYPFDAPKHAIDYDQCAISQQAYTTNGCVAKAPSPYDFCYYIDLKSPIPAGMTPNGMSGSPIYGILPTGYPVFCGMVIESNRITGTYLAVGPEVLVNSLRQLDQDECAGS